MTRLTEGRLRLIPQAMAQLVRERSVYRAGVSRSRRHYFTSPVRSRSIFRELRLRAGRRRPGCTTDNREPGNGEVCCAVPEVS